MSGQHLDLDALADLLVGEGDAAHLTGCAACSSALVDLEDAQHLVAADLARLAAEPVPSPPADLLDRVQAALGSPDAAPTATAAPVALTGAPLSTPAGAVADVVPLRPRTPARSSSLLGVAAAAAGLLAVVGLGIGLTRGGSGADSAASGAADRAVAAADLPELPTTASGNDYRRDGAVLAQALPGLLAPGEPGAAGETAGGTAGGTAAGSGADAAAAPAPGALAPAPTGVGGGVSAQAPAAEQAVPVDPLARLRDPAELAGCLAELTGPDAGGFPLALDYAAFEGQPALVVVLPSAREGKVDVFVVGAGCRGGDDQTLLFSRLDRP